MSVRPRRWTDQEIRDAYAATGSVHKAAEMLGGSHASVHERLVKLGACKPINVFTDDERERLAREYVIYRDAGRLDELAALMGRTKPFISRQAGKLGLTDRNAPNHKARTWKGMTATVAEVIWEDFKMSSLGLGHYCRSKGYDDLGFSRTMREHFGDEWDHVIELKTPKQSLYRLGRAFEYAIRDRLRDVGYFVMRSPASRSPIDLMAVAPGVVLMVQCKRGGALPVGEWNDLYDLASSCGAWPIMAERIGACDVRYWVMEDRKDGSRRRQPMREVDPHDFLEPSGEAAMHLAVLATKAAARKYPLQEDAA